MTSDPTLVEVLRSAYHTPADASAQARLTAIQFAVDHTLGYKLGGDLLAEELWSRAAACNPQAWAGIGTDGVLMASCLQRMTPPGQRFLPVMQIDLGSGDGHGPRLSGLTGPGQQPPGLSLVVPVLTSPLRLARALRTVLGAGHTVRGVVAVVVASQLSLRREIDAALATVGAELVHATTIDQFEGRMV